MTADHLVRTVPAVVLAVTVAIAVVLGPVGLKLIAYRVSPAGIAQYTGGEVVTLAAAAVATWAAFARPGIRGTLLGLGASAYIVYTMVTVVVGQDYLRYGGNAEQYFPLFVVITTAAIFSGAQAVTRLGGLDPLPDRLAARITLAVISAAFLFLWISALIAERRAPSPEYAADPTLFWLIKYLDLAVVIPTGLVAAIVWSGGWRMAGMSVLAFSTWMTAAIAGMQVGMVLIEKAPTSTLGVAAVMAVATACCGTLILTS